MKKLILSLVFFSLTSAHAGLLELNSAQEFNDLVNNSTVPVVVQFSAYWCGPCQQLKAVFKKVTPEYTDNQVKVAYVDAYVIKSLQKYLQGGYPTVRVFRKKEVTGESFVGSKSESYVRNFLNTVVQNSEEEMDLESGGSCAVELRD